MSEWKECKIGDVVEIDSGFAFKSKLYSEKGSLRVIRGKNVTVGQTRWGNDTRYWNHSTDGLERYFLSEGDVVIGMDGSKIGENRTQIKKSDLPAAIPVVTVNACNRRVVSLCFRKHLCVMLSNG